VTDPFAHDTTGFYEIVRRRERGKLKVYVGSAAGTGKTYRMLQEAHDLRRRGVDAVVGFIETHGRAETDAQVRDLEVVPRKSIAYRNVTLEEMDLDAIVTRRPQVAIVDELAHTNVPGARHRKRWEDILELLDEGINVISAVNVQHLESLNDVIQRTLGVTVRETVPDWVVSSADQVINLDISSEDLQQRLREGKIYAMEKVAPALQHFFTDANLTTLRELALREVASSVDRTREGFVRREEGEPHARAAVERVLVALSSSQKYSARLLRRASRIAGRLNSDWYCVYVDTPDASLSTLDSARHRALADSLQLAQELGGEVMRLQGQSVAAAITHFALAHGVTLLLLGQSRRSRWHRWRHGSVVQQLVRNSVGLDVLIVALDEGAAVDRAADAASRSPSGGR
jgi:two-component system sensor histidine kinase KdpD